MAQYLISVLGDRTNSALAIEARVTTLRMVGGLTVPHRSASAGR